ncbi:DNA polymerase alpha accessory factor Mcl1 [Blastocladiella emersonii ATCC 22665]|nr:DNA polymerase alpha accessory factor Mcl1 [Blastocladiella emersonii ATCC 22665]
MATDRVNHTLWGVPRDLAFSPDGLTLVSTEDSGIARIFRTDPDLRDKEPAQINYAGLDQPFAVACHSSTVAVSTKGTVMLFSLPGGEYKQLLTRHTLPVRALAYLRAGDWIASAGDDMVVRVTSTARIEDMHELRHHAAPVTGLAFDPLGTYLASVAADGRLVIWNVAEGRTMVADVDVRAGAGVAPDAPVPRVAWSPTGGAVAVCVGTKEVAVIARNRFSIVRDRLTHHKEPVTSLAWSPNGRYLASAARDHAVAVWSVDALAAPPREITFSSTPLLLRWQPNRNTIALATESQALTLIDNPVDGNVLGGAATEQAGDALASAIFDRPPTAARSAAVPQQRRSAMLDIEAGDDDDGMDLDGAGGGASSADEGGDADEDLDDASDLDDFLVDEADGKSRKQKKAELKKEFLRAGFTEATPIQPAFQPGSTPTISGKRYLAFNTLGVITSVEQEVRHAYHVEFHDRSRMRRPLQFSDAREFSLASLSTRAAVFASAPTSAADPDDPSTADAVIPGVLHARLLDGSGATAAAAARSAWTLPLGPHEVPLGLAAGDDRLVLVTDAGTVRVVTLGGVLVHAFSLPGRFVACAASGSWAIIATHAAAPFNGDQQLAYCIYDLARLATVVHDARLPLSPKSRLEWIGFSGDHGPITYDSAGVVRGLGVASDRQWTPLLDTTAHIPESVGAGAPGFAHWFVGLAGDTALTVLCRIPAGAARAYPGFPRPALTETSIAALHVLGGGNNDDAAWSALRFRRANALDGDTESAAAARDRLAREMDKAALVMMQAACKAERPARALDLARVLTLEVSLEKAVKVANFNNMPALAERVRQIIEDRRREPEMADEDGSPLDDLLMGSSQDSSMASTARSLPPLPAAGTVRRRADPPAAPSPADEYPAYEPTAAPAEPPAAKKPKFNNPFAARRAAAGASPFLAAPASAAASTAGGSTTGLARSTSFARTMEAGIVKGGAAAKSQQQSSMARFVVRGKKPEQAAVASKEGDGGEGAGAEGEEQQVDVEMD